MTPLRKYTFTWITSIRIPSSVENIGDSAFWGCESLKTVTIPTSVKMIDSFAFGACGIEEIYFEGTVEQWNAIEKKDRWCFLTNNFTVHCIDGDITNE